MNLQLLEEMIANAVDKDDWGHWKTATYLVDVDPMKSYGFVYVIRNKANDKLYIGRKNTRHFGKKSSKNYGKETNWKRYTGSSKHVTEDIKNFGKDNFEFIILEFYNTRGGLNYCEIAFQIKCDVMTAKLPDGERQFYNGQVGAVRWIPKESISDTHRAALVSEDSRAKMAAAKRGKPAVNPNNVDNLNHQKPYPVLLTKGKEEIKFVSCDEAANFLGCDKDGVARVARGDRKTIYKWKVSYLKENN
jgi:hypothetical protein